MLEFHALRQFAEKSLVKKVKGYKFLQGSKDQIGRIKVLKNKIGTAQNIVVKPRMCFLQNKKPFVNNAVADQAFDIHGVNACEGQSDVVV